MPTRRLILVLAAVAATVALVAGVYFGRSTFGIGGSEGGSRDAATLLGVTLPDANGTEQALAEWRGKVLVVNFWATWCAPCREEMPEFVRAQADLGGRGLQFVGIAIDSPDKVRPFVEEIGLNYPSLIGGYGAMELSKTLGNRLMALPFTVVVDRRGAIVHTQLGPLRDAQLRAIIGQLL